MATEQKIRRGTAVEHETFTGAQGELTWDTTNNILIGHDGVKVGGFKHVTEGTTTNITYVVFDSFDSMIAGDPAEVALNRFGSAPTGIYKRVAESNPTVASDFVRISDSSLSDFSINLDGSDETTKLQAAIDSLNPNGGTLVAYGSSAPTITSITVPTDKLITIKDRNNVLTPDLIPQVGIESSGDFDQPHAGGVGTSTRPGNAYVAYRVKHSVKATQANQQDSIYYVQGEAIPPSAGSGLTTEFAAYRFNMTMDNGTEAGAGIRGIHGTMSASNGNAKVRSYRSISIGQDGHDGLLTGIVQTTYRRGIIPISAGGNGIDEYQPGDAGPYVGSDNVITAAVGPGVRDMFVGESQDAGGARPQTMLLQRGGNQKLLSENATIRLHDEGNGVAIDLFADSTYTGDAIFSVEKKGTVKAAASYSGTESMTNDTAITIVPNNKTGFIELFAESTSESYGRIYFRADGTPIAKLAYGGTAFAVTTGPLTGTTGSPGNLTVSVDGSGNIYIENRTSVTRQVTWNITGR